MKPKTLNDIEKKIYYKLEHEKPFNVFQEIKQEAIKWVKYFQKRNKDALWNTDADQEHWVKHFFNITEEDLE